MTTSAPSHWPPPLETVNPDGQSNVLLLCEHASNFIPAEYDGLGLPPSELQRHIAWDIGAAEVTRRLAKLLDAPAFLGTYSRLLIDLNRPLHAPSSIVTRSEATGIPGNSRLTPAERARRATLMFEPFHQAVETHLAQREKDGRKAIIVAVHSFTPSYAGAARPWHAGIIYDKAPALAESIIDRLRAADESLVVEGNVPYSVTPEDYYGLLVYGDNVGRPAILIEIRQDLLEQAEQQQAWAQRLAAALEST
ncbi:MAG: N-formylglutamate amidohydrolase [Gammaproteobacteria bacterium]